MSSRCSASSWRPSGASTSPTTWRSSERPTATSLYFEITLRDGPGVWDMFRPARFLKQVTVLTFNDINIEELEKGD